MMFLPLIVAIIVMSSHHNDEPVKPADPLTQGVILGVFIMQTILLIVIVRSISRMS